MDHPLLNDIKHRLEYLTEMVESIKAGNKTFLNLEEAACYLGISKSTLYKHTHKNAISFYKPNGKLILFRKDELDSWINKLRVPSNSELINLHN